MVHGQSPENLHKEEHNEPYELKCAEKQRKNNLLVFAEELAGLFAQSAGIGVEASQYAFLYIFFFLLALSEATKATTLLPSFIQIWTKTKRQQQPPSSAPLCKVTCVALTILFTRNLVSFCLNESQAPLILLKTSSYPP